MTRRPAHRVTAWISASLLAGCSAGFEPPCEIAAENLDVAAGISGSLVPRPDQGPTLIRCLDPRWPGSIAEVVELSIDGTLIDRWSIELTGGYTALPSTCTWTGDGLAIVSLETESSEDGDKSGLTYRFVDTDGIVQVERPLSDAQCTDCFVDWTSQPFGDHVALLLFKSDTAAQTLWLLAPDGTIERKADLSWPAGGGLQAIATLGLSNRGDGLVVARGSDSWLLDAQLERIAGPINGHADGPAALDWDLSAETVTASRVTVPEAYLLYESFGLNGAERAPPERLSTATASLAVHAHNGFVSIAFAAGPSMYMALTDAAGNKLGGDLELGPIQPQTHVLLNGQSGETSAYVASQRQTDWLRVSCAP